MPRLERSRWARVALRLTRLADGEVFSGAATRECKKLLTNESRIGRLSEKSERKERHIGCRAGEFELQATYDVAVNIQMEQDRRREIS